MKKRLFLVPGLIYFCLYIFQISEAMEQPQDPESTVQQEQKVLLLKKIKQAEYWRNIVRQELAAARKHKIKPSPSSAKGTLSVTRPITWATTTIKAVRNAASKVKTSTVKQSASAQTGDITTTAQKSTQTEEIVPSGGLRKISSKERELALLGETSAHLD